MPIILSLQYPRTVFFFIYLAAELLRYVRRYTLLSRLGYSIFPPDLISFLWCPEIPSSRDSHVSSDRSWPLSTTTSVIPIYILPIDSCGWPNINELQFRHKWTSWLQIAAMTGVIYYHSETVDATASSSSQSDLIRQDAVLFGHEVLFRVLGRGFP